MKFENAAQRHIRQIRQAKGLDDNSVPRAIVQDLEAATKVLSEQLYQKSTRFLMELIQNADDNHYKRGILPTLHLTYANNHLRVDCNEVGFSEKNVEAICSIGRSSKALAADDQHGYVGEKGIGFKAVFKVADVVWVSSNDYSFKFDKHQPLGMIAPIPDRLPGQRRAGWTSFYLQLSQDYNSQELIDELKGLDPHLLMFLRRLKKIDINIVESADNIWTTSLVRSEHKFDKLEGLKLSQDAKSVSYIMMKHKAEGLQGEAKRSGISESEMLLAFPLDENRQPILRPQHVFAFLPIRDYGFKFLIHADFLLIASREDIDGSSKWNKTIRDQVADAFVASAQRFNETRDFMRYLWPRYIPLKPITTNFFTPLKQSILQKLRTETILKCWSGDWVKPEDLIFIPPRFRDESGIPFTLAGKREKRYLSPKYANGDYEHLKLIGVQEMDEIRFLADLRIMLESSFDSFKRKPAAWHSQLASILSSFTEELREQLKDLPLIQLRTNQWVCAKEDNILFPSQSVNWVLPGGIDILVVHADAISSHARKHLYSLLGVRPFNMTEITLLILQQHADKDFDAKKVSRKDLISQMLFLFETGWRRRGPECFWMATEDDDRSLARHLYIDRHDIPYSATTLFANSRAIHKFIHPDYLSAFTKDPTTWLNWLHDNLGVSYIPHLVSITEWDQNTHKKLFEMSPHFQFLLQQGPWLDVLCLICEHWQYYSQWIAAYSYAGSDADEQACYEELKLKLSTVKVRSIDGRVCELKDTFLPLEELVARQDGKVLFLNVPDPNHPRWYHLHDLGVGVKDDVNFYLRSLDSLAGTDCRLQQVSYILEQIQARFADDEEAVANYFCNKAATILFPLSMNRAGEPAEGSEYAWVKLKQCLWNGPPWLRRHFCLKTVYPLCHRLLTDVVSLNDASMKELILEVLSYREDDPVEYIRDVLAELDKFLEKDKTYTVQLEPLGPREVWPLSTTEDIDKIDRLAAARADFDWFIADTELYRDSFAGIIPLLSVPNDGIQRIERLLNSMDLDKKRLSVAATSEPRIVGQPQYSQVYTQALRAKSDFLTRLVPRSSGDQKKVRDVVRQLNNIEVHTAARVIQKYLVKCSSKLIESRECPGNVVLTPQDDGLNIYLREGYLEQETNPDELVRNLAAFTGIDRRQDGMYLLLFTIIEPDLNKIATAFRRANIPVEYPEDKEGDREWLKSPRRQLESREVPDFELSNSFSILSSGNMRGASSGVPSTLNDGNGAVDGPGALRGMSLSNGMRISIPSRLSSRGFMSGHGAVDPDLAFRGEEFFSKFLEKTMKEHYLPTEHWTSPFRSKSGKLSPYNRNGKKMSSFTIKDKQAVWTTIASRSGFDAAREWTSRPPTWHFEVKCTNGPVAERFVWTPEDFEHARSLSLSAQIEAYGIPKDVLMLIRVVNLDSVPEMKLYSDPWALLSCGDLRLTPPGNYWATI